MGIHKSGKKRSDLALQMECIDDELSPAQLSYYNKAESEYQEFRAKAETAIKSANGELIESGEHIKLWEINNQLTTSSFTPKIIPNSVASITPPQIRQSIPLPTSVQLPTTPLVIQNNVSGSAGALVTRTSPVVNATPSQYQLVVDPRLGLIVGSVGQATPSTATVPVPAGAVLQAGPPPLAALTPPLPNAPVTLTPRARVAQVTPSVQAKQTNGTYRPRASTVITPSAGTGMANIRMSSRPSSIIRNTNKTTPVNARFKPTEENSIGGVGPKAAAAAKNKSVTALVDLTNDDKSDSKEVTFNKLTGKTFPSLVVVARPTLKLNELNQGHVNQQRGILDVKVKQVLVHTPTKFTEWLIQQGLVRSEQYCSIHINPDMSPVKLKLGMYSDASKFPYSGGYVWISDCCPQRFVSVFSGSIFEGAPHAATVLLKLIYHWSCQTNVQNITQWVKVDNFYVKSFFTNLRSVCTAAVHEKFDKLGGNKKKVEVGVISLGTTSHDGNMRQVKVEVLGVMERDSKLIRLRAVEPLQDGERNYRRRFVKILEPLEQWVDKDSIILTDSTVDKNTLHNMGFKSVYQVAPNDKSTGTKSFSNANMMEYLRRVVPRMFQNTLSLLSRQIIQQFLDELVWRERWGYMTASCFDTMIIHLAEQTKLDTGDTLMARLNKIAANPFKNWAYANWKVNATGNTNAPPAQRQILTTPATPAVTQPTPQPTTGQKRFRAATTTLQPGESEPKKVHTNSNRGTNIFNNTELRPLDSFYYGVLPGDSKILAEQKNIEINMKCCVCQRLMKDNISMMKHLIDHAYNEGTYISADPIPICRYCPFKLTGFPSDFALQNHVDEVHLKASGVFMCLICEEKFRDRTTLILHMHHNHNELELPYECGVCNMRASQHNVIVDHFYEVHKNGDSLQCPYCLKIVAVEKNGRKMTQNLFFYLNHIQKHQRKTIARKCPKCTLWFVHKGILKDHQIMYHKSCKEMEGVERTSSTALDTIMMPTPLESGVQPPKVATKNKPNLIKMFTLNAIENLSIYCGETPNVTCCECEGDFRSEGHFPGYLACLKCRFSTCCNKSMQEHIVIFHDRANLRPEFNLGKVITLDKPMHCVCGYSCSSGNKLARHLADCKRKSAYPTSERAMQNTVQGQSANFPPLITLDEQETEESWQRSYVQRSETSDPKPEKPVNPISSTDPPSMLNILGLVRKSSVDESSQDKLSDGENSSPSVLKEDIPQEKSDTTDPLKEKDNSDDNMEKSATTDPLKEKDNISDENTEKESIMEDAKKDKNMENETIAENAKEIDSSHHENMELVAAAEPAVEDEAKLNKNETNSEEKVQEMESKGEDQMPQPMEEQ